MSEERSKNDKKISLIEFLSTKTSLPSDILLGGFRLEIRGRNSVMCFGCSSILKYTPCCIIMASKDFSVGILGCRLICTSYHEGAVSIEGFIEKIEFDPDTTEGV